MDYPKNNLFYIVMNFAALSKIMHNDYKETKVKLSYSFLDTCLMICL